MTRFLVFANRKGGCGKTTTAVNGSHGLVRLGKTVLLIDLDPQAHATLSLGFSPDTIETSVFHLLNGEKTLAEVMRATPIKGLSLVPASRDLISYNVRMEAFQGNESCLAEGLRQLPEHFDYLIVDPPPAVGMLSLSALVAMKEVYIPMPMHFLAMEGLAEMTRLIYTVNASHNPNFRLSGIIPTFFNRNTRIAKDISSDIENTFGAAKLMPGIRMKVHLAEAPGHGQSVLDYSPRSIGAMDYQDLAVKIDQHKER